MSNKRATQCRNDFQMCLHKHHAIELLNLIFELVEMFHLNENCIQR